MWSQTKGRFSAIARSVMISAGRSITASTRTSSFSAIARSVMISAYLNHDGSKPDILSFSAIARSVMISA